MTVIICTASMASTTGNFMLSATIPPKLQLAVISSPKANYIDLDLPQEDLQIAVIAENANSPGGYRIRAKSRHGGKFSNESRGSVSYTMKYAGGTVLQLGKEDQDVKFKDPGEGRGSGERSSVTISYPGAKSLGPGAYSDTITFTMESL